MQYFNTGYIIVDEKATVYGNDWKDRELWMRFYILKIRLLKILKKIKKL